MPPINVIDNHYNLSGLINSSSIGNFMTNLAVPLGGYWLGDAFLIIIWAITFLYLKGTHQFLNRSCVMGAMSITLISGILLFSMGMLGVGVMWLTVVLWIGSLFIIIFAVDEG